MEGKGLSRRHVVMIGATPHMFLTRHQGTPRKGRHSFMTCSDQPNVNTACACYFQVDVRRASSCSDTLPLSLCHGNQRCFRWKRICQSGSHNNSNTGPRHQLTHIGDVVRRRSKSCFKSEGYCG